MIDDQDISRRIVKYGFNSISRIGRINWQKETLQVKYCEFCSAKVQSLRQQKGNWYLAWCTVGRANSMRVAGNHRQDITCVEPLEFRIANWNLCFQGMAGIESDRGLSAAKRVALG